jgi:thiol-disulfide isomerase/thioredoxin
LLTWSCAFFAAGAWAENGAETLFSIALPDVRNDETVEFARFRGKPLIVNFWARGCPPCREEIPELMALQKKYATQGLAIVGIALENDPLKVREFLAAYEVTYPVVLAPGQGVSMMKALGNDRELLPFTLIVGPQGEIVLRKPGRFRQDDFESVADALPPGESR